MYGLAELYVPWHECSVRTLCKSWGAADTFPWICKYTLSRDLKRTAPVGGSAMCSGACALGCECQPSDMLCVASEIVTRVEMVFDV